MNLALKFIYSAVSDSEISHRDWMLTLTVGAGGFKGKVSDGRYEGFIVIF